MIVSKPPFLIKNVITRRSPILLSSIRHYSTPPKQPQGGGKIEIQHLGIATDVYIHPSPNHLPSIFSHPILRSKGIWRRFLALFQNTAMVAQFRLKSKIKPRFVEWKNLALENYVSVNKAFASNTLDSIQDSMSIWVFESLKQRSKSVPAGTRLEWKLVKFNSVPRIMAIQPMMLPDAPLTLVQIIYRIESRQKLVRVARGSDNVESVERDVTDYVGYVFDAGKTPATVVMSGTVFENQPRPDPSQQDNEAAMIKSMKDKGDIFRAPPSITA